MPLLSKASNVVQNVFFLYDVTGFTQIGHSIPVATNCTVRPTGGSLRMASFSKVRVPYTLCAQIYDICTAILSQFTTRHESSPRAQTRSNRIRALMASRETFLSGNRPGPDLRSVLGAPRSGPTPNRPGPDLCSVLGAPRSGPRITHGRAVAATMSNSATHVIRAKTHVTARSAASQPGAQIPKP